jgi:hypothetical protein
MAPFNAWAAKIKIWLSFFAIYLSIAGLSSFSMFIIEESIQCVQFGTWQAISAQDWPLVKKGAVLMKGINKSLKAVNYSTGLINPLSFLSYYDYMLASDYYVEALNANIFANDSGLFNGEVVSFKFSPDEIEKRADGQVILRNRNIEVLTKEVPPEGLPLRVTGRITRSNGKVMVTETIIKTE